MKTVKKILGIVLTIACMLLFAICIATIGKIIAAGNLEKDLSLAVVMAVMAAISLVPVILACRRLAGDKRVSSIIENMGQFMENRTGKKIDARIILLVIALTCILILFFVGHNFAVEMILLWIGSFCMLGVGTINALKLKEQKKNSSYQAIRGSIGMPTMLYILVFYMIMKYVVGM
ncbi:MAG: hypothetical protein KBT01_10180 [Clostridiales bacterium]|nr:hypothetical protein [Candidatus Blautia equi]